MLILVRFGNWLGAMAVAGVLLVAFVLQFAQHELPCPLCNLQRVALVLCSFGSCSTCATARSPRTTA